MPLHTERPQPPDRGAVFVLSSGPDELRGMVSEDRGRFQAYAIAFDAKMALDGGKKTDAVVVESGVRGDPSAWSFAQPYSPKRPFRKFKRLGDIVLFEETKNLLAE